MTTIVTKNATPTAHRPGHRTDQLASLLPALAFFSQSLLPEFAQSSTGGPTTEQHTPARTAAGS